MPRSRNMRWPQPRLGSGSSDGLPSRPARRLADGNRRMSRLPVRTADVVIVGAGVQGASLAFHLASRGTKVLVLERSSVAAGATGRAQGDAAQRRALAMAEELRNAVGSASSSTPTKPSS